jgi:hypothetical protein
MGKYSPRKTVVTFLALAVGALHFFTGENYKGPYPVFVNGYMIDILLPMAIYLLLGLFEIEWIRSTLFRAAAVFLFGCVVETSQYLGYPLFGSTFDPLDILAYTGGVASGIFLDLILLPRIVPYWNQGSQVVN